MSEKPASVLWLNFLVWEKLNPKKMTKAQLDNFLKLAQVLGEKGRPAYNPYAKKLESRKLVCETAIDLSIDLMAYPKFGRGLLDAWVLTYKARFGSTIGTAAEKELKRRAVVTKLGHGPRPNLEKFNDYRGKADVSGTEKPGSN